MKIILPKQGIGAGHWNHRVIRHLSMRGGLQGERFLTLEEVYYDAQGRAHVATDGKGVGGETVDELHDTLRRMFKALKKPILTYRAGKLIEVRAGRAARGTPFAKLPRATQRRTRAMVKRVTDLVGKPKARK